MVTYRWPRLASVDDPVPARSSVVYDLRLHHLKVGALTLAIFATKT